MCVNSYLTMMNDHINVWEHMTRVFLPQPKKLDLEIPDPCLSRMLHVT